MSYMALVCFLVISKRKYVNRPSDSGYFKASLVVHNNAEFFGCLGGWRKVNGHLRTRLVEEKGPKLKG